MPVYLVLWSPEKEKAGEPILNSEFPEREGAGMAEKFPIPEIEKVNRTGSPRETFWASMETDVSNVPIAPSKNEGLPFIGSGLISIFSSFDFT